MGGDVSKMAAECKQCCGPVEPGWEQHSQFQAPYVSAPVYSWPQDAGMDAAGPYGPGAMPPQQTRTAPVATQHLVLPGGGAADFVAADAWESQEEEDNGTAMFAPLPPPLPGELEDPSPRHDSEQSSPRREPPSASQPPLPPPAQAAAGQRPAAAAAGQRPAAAAEAPRSAAPAPAPSPPRGAGGGAAARESPARAPAPLAAAPPPRAAASAAPAPAPAYGGGSADSGTDLEVVLCDVESAEMQAYGVQFADIARGQASLDLDNMQLRDFVLTNSALSAEELDTELLKTASSNENFCIDVDGFISILRKHAVAESDALQQFVSLSSDGVEISAEDCRNGLSNLLKQRLNTTWPASTVDHVSDVVMRDANLTISMEQWIGYCKLMGRIARLARVLRL